MRSRNLVGERVRLARNKRSPRLAQQELAARLQLQGLRIDRAAISKIETGYREVTDVDSAAIARVLGVRVGWLFGEGEEGGSRRDRNG